MADKGLIQIALGRRRRSLQEKLPGYVDQLLGIQEQYLHQLHHVPRDLKNYLRPEIGGCSGGYRLDTKVFQSSRLGCCLLSTISTYDQQERMIGKLP